MTTVAIVGGGVAGLSLAYVLAKRSNPPEKILVFDSDDFAQTCSLRSTAIVAQRGVSSGNSALGDDLLKGFQCFKQHVQSASPVGVFKISQFTVALTKLDAFKLRYPHGDMKRSAGFVKFIQEHYTSEEEAFLIDPPLYLNWLKEQCGERVQFVRTFITEIRTGETPVSLFSVDGESWKVDKVIFTTGVSNPQWDLGKSKKVQGGHWEFNSVNFGESSLALTIEGMNFIYHAHTKKLLIGSTTDEVSHLLPHQKSLKEILVKLQASLELDLPDPSKGKIKVGLREKGPQRRPYTMGQNPVWSIGGFYKNGWSLGLSLAQDLADELLKP